LLDDDLNAWFAIDPSIGKPLFTVPSSILGAFKPLTLRDSLAVARYTQIMWLQSIRKVGLEYDNQFDYRFDFSTGGPVADGVKFFLASRQSSTTVPVPTTNPDVERQVMSNLTFQLSQSDKLKANFIYALVTRNYLDGGWLYWTMDPTTSVTQLVQTTTQYGVEWNHILNPSTFMDLRFNVLNVTSKENLELVADDEFREIYTQNLQWPDYTGPSQHSSVHVQASRGNQTLSTYDFQGSINSQLNKYNLLKTGFQFSYYDLNVNREQDITSAATIQRVKFNNFPLEGGLYIQDKMEFDGFIANIGLRFDFYNMNTDYYSDIYSPLRNPYRTSDDGLDYYDQDLAAKETTKLYTKIQPRIGISFPITETTVFHLNYGTFTQRPSFSQVFYNQLTYYNDIQFLGNPRLQPENTRAYDIGLVNAFPLGLRLELSAYYKDVTNLIEISNYEDEKTTKYKTYTNREYADIKGFVINIDMAEGALRGYVRYNYEAAKGKNSSDLVSPVTYSEIEVNNTLPDPEDVYLDYDRTHKAVINARYQTASKDGFSIGKVYPLGNMSFSVTYRYTSGRPYTYDASGQGLKYNMRSPTETELRMRIEKTIRFSNTSVLFYGEVFNLLNDIIYNYSVVFNDPESSFNKDKWHNDPESIRTYDEFKPYTTDQSVRVISNQPRYFRFGVVFKF
jgi:outer membrane receptor protein involved in Fe transport